MTYKFHQSSSTFRWSWLELNTWLSIDNIPEQAVQTPAFGSATEISHEKSSARSTYSSWSFLLDVFASGIYANLRSEFIENLSCYSHLKWAKRNLENEIPFLNKSTVEDIHKIFDVFRIGGWVIGEQQISESLRSAVN